MLDGYERKERERKRGRKNANLHLNVIKSRGKKEREMNEFNSIIHLNNKMKYERLLERGIKEKKK